MIWTRYQKEPKMVQDMVILTTIKGTHREEKELEILYMYHKIQIWSDKCQFISVSIPHNLVESGKIAQTAKSLFSKVYSNEMFSLLFKQSIYTRTNSNTKHLVRVLVGCLGGWYPQLWWWGNLSPIGAGAELGNDLLYICCVIAGRYLYVYKLLYHLYCIINSVWFHIKSRSSWVLRANHTSIIIQKLLVH